jgi:hypothetical protein
VIPLLLLAATLPVLVDQPPAGAEKLLRPGTRRGNLAWASSSRGPWVDANGWKIRRNPTAEYFYDSVPAQWAALAMAEAFVYGAKASIKTDATGAATAQEMAAFLKNVHREEWPEMADVFVVDDGTPILGEVLNLMARRNLLYQTGTTPDRPYPLVVKLGEPDFPKQKASNPSEFSYLVRKKLGDPKRSLRVFGSETIVGRLTTGGGRAQLHLLNYATDPVEALRVRVAGEWKVLRIVSFKDGRLQPDELALDAGGTEFGVPKLTTYAVVDLAR